MVRRRARNPPWADLPREILFDIASLLTSDRVDILAFRAVCKSWNSSAPSVTPLILCPPLPFTAVYPGYCLDQRFIRRNLGVPIITATAVFAVSCREEEDTKSWLLFADQLNPGKIMIRQPFTKKYYPLPVNFPRYLDAPNIRVDEIARFYNLSFYHEVNKPPNVWSEHVLKVVMSSDQKAAVALFRTGQLGLIRLWIPKDGWAKYATTFAGPNRGDERVDDVVCYNGKFLCVDRVGRLYELGYWALKVIVPLILELGTKRKRLVESNGELYLVVRGSFGGDERNIHDFFTVLKLHKKLKRWVRVSSVSGRSFFFGLDFSFSVLPQDLGESSGGNCIIYKEGSFKDYERGVNDDFIFCYAVESENHHIAVWPMNSGCAIRVIGSYRGYPNIIWPPPAWLWPNDDMSKHFGDHEAAHDILPKSIADQNSKTISKELSRLEQVLATAPTGDITSYQDASTICKIADTVKEYLKEVGDIYKHIESYKIHALSRQNHSNAMNLQNQDGSGVWKVAHTAMEYLKQFRDFYKRMLSDKTNAVNLQNQVRSFIPTEAEEKQGSVKVLHSTSEYSETHDCNLSSKTRLHALLVHLEESTSKLQNIVKLHLQPRSC